MIIKSVTTRGKPQFSFEILGNSKEHVLKLQEIEHMWGSVCIKQLSFCHMLRHTSKRNAKFLHFHVALLWLSVLLQHSVGESQVF